MNWCRVQTKNAEVAEFIITSDVTSGTNARHATDQVSSKEGSSSVRAIPKEWRNVQYMDKDELDLFVF